MARSRHRKRPNDPPPSSKVMGGDFTTTAKRLADHSKAVCSVCGKQGFEFTSRDGAPDLFRLTSKRGSELFCQGCVEDYLARLQPSDLE